MSPKTMPMQATAAGAQARVAPEGAAVPIFAVALIKSGPEPLTKYTASAAIRKCLGKNPCKGLIANNGKRQRRLRGNHLPGLLARNGHSNPIEHGTW
jgi:hypothetical protein